MFKIPDTLTRQDLEFINEQLKNVEEKQRLDLANKQTKGIDLTNLDLSNYNFENDNVDIEGCILDKNTINFLQFHGRKNFSKIVVQNQNLGLAYTYNEEIGIGLNQGFFFDNLNLSYAKFINCDFNQAAFRECNLDYVYFDNCQNVEKAKVINCTQNSINIVIPEFIAKTSKPNRFFNFIGRIVSLKILANILGDGLPE